MSGIQIDFALIYRDGRIPAFLKKIESTHCLFFSKKQNKTNLDHF